MLPYSIIDRYYPAGPLRDILITHSELVRDKALAVLRRSGLPFNEKMVSDGAMLHDIGIFLCDAPGIECHGTEPYIRHGILGGEILRKEGYPELARFCERHTGAGLTIEDIVSQNLPLPHVDMLPETIEEKAVCYADKFFSKSGDIRKEKTFEKAKASMVRHGSSTLHRFLQLHHLFVAGASELHLQK
ncbi:MAG: HDIG domain-containing protein [Muribaculaceae bacterium]|nr:HDIG domain-containing protein [Muribaculaceae bacterium]